LVFGALVCTWTLANIADGSCFYSGGGIGGLVLAQALSRSAHIQVQVYEAASTISGKGTGLGIFRRTWLILQKLGLGEAMDELCGAMGDELGVCAYYL
jgi:hypothetical protein